MEDAMTYLKQLTLDLTNNGKAERQVVYNGIPARKATFKAGLVLPVHRWFRLTPSFGPDLVNEMLNAMGASASDVVFDPFSGAGTTLIECQIKGLESFGFEINPFLQFVCQTCLDWELNSEQLHKYFQEIGNKFQELDAQFVEGDLNNGKLTTPRIHDPFRWWRRDVLKSALVLKLIISQSGFPTRVQDFFTLALAGVLVPDLTNITLGRLQLHFIDRSNDDINVWATFSQHTQTMINDLAGLQKSVFRRTSYAYHADSTSEIAPRYPKSADLVITSPPYPNRYSYVWNTRPHLYFFDFFERPRQAAELDKVTIGGTWGAATSDLIKTVVIPEYPIVKEVIGPVAERIRQADNLMANYLLRYFNLLAKQLLSMERLLSRHAKLAYVVGCSRLKGVYIETDVLLAEMIEGIGLGYRVSSIERIRRRNSGKDLHESIVYAQK